jgi:hypothetical protein
MTDSSDLVERLEEIKEMLIAQEEVRQLGHRVVWNERGECNVPGVASLSGETLQKQLERQRKWYK